MQEGSPIGDLESIRSQLIRNFVFVYEKEYYEKEYINLRARKMDTLRGIASRLARAHGDDPSQNGRTPKYHLYLH